MDSGECLPTTKRVETEPQFQSALEGIEEKPSLSAVADRPKHTWALLSGPPLSSCNNSNNKNSNDSSDNDHNDNRVHFVSDQCGIPTQNESLMAPLIIERRSTNMSEDKNRLNQRSSTGSGGGSNSGIASLYRLSSRHHHHHHHLSSVAADASNTTLITRQLLEINSELHHELQSHLPTQEFVVDIESSLHQCHTLEEYQVFVSTFNMGLYQDSDNKITFREWLRFELHNAGRQYKHFVADETCADPYVHINNIRCDTASSGDGASPKHDSANAQEGSATQSPHKNSTVNADHPTVESHANIKDLKQIDIFAFGMQEMKMDASKINDLLLDIVGKNTFTILKYRRLREIYLVILVKHNIVHTIDHRRIQARATRTGIGNLYGNKGAVGISFKVNRTSLCFVCAHLAASYSHKFLRDRIEDIVLIINGLGMGFSQIDFTHTYHALFLLGDLNFRLQNISWKDAVTTIQNGQYLSLLRLDELNQLRAPCSTDVFDDPALEEWSQQPNPLYASDKHSNPNNGHSILTPVLCSPPPLRPVKDSFAESPVVPSQETSFKRNKRTLAESAVVSMEQELMLEQQQEQEQEQEQDQDQEQEQEPDQETIQIQEPVQDIE
ncbi:hypothetical protein RFI_24275, partial [Reticulomyxa filosa]